MDLQRKVGGLPVWGWVVVGGAGLFFVYRYIKAKGAKKGTTGAATASGSGVPGSYYTPRAAGGGGGGGVSTSQQLGSILGQLSALQGQIGTAQAQVKTVQAHQTTFAKKVTAATTAAQAAQAAAQSTSSALSSFAGPTLGHQTIGGSEYDILGGFAPTGKYTGYNVSGGAPVYFTWTGQGTPEQVAPPQGAKGVVVYTPTSTPGSQISSTKQSSPATWSKGYTGTT